MPQKLTIIGRTFRVKALVWMLMGAFAVLGFAVIMNSFNSTPEAKPKKAVAKFEVAPPPPPPPPPPPKPKPKKSKPKPSNATPPPSIGSNLAGLDMGLEGFGTGAMGDMDDALLGDTSDVVMDAQSVDVPPKPSNQQPLSYPKKARKNGIEGHVVVNILVDERGRIERIKVLESVPQGVFDDVALQGVKTWQFAPAKYQGKAVKVWAKQKIRFSLN